MRGRMTLGAFLIVGLAIALALAFFVSPEASSKPDGLNRVAIDQGFDDEAKAHTLDDAPTSRLSTGLAGVTGVMVTFGFGYGLFALARRSRRADLAKSC